ncbi:hypothetical protein BDV12DRAFT_195201 [Aspergillus spectabilis]
MARLATSFYFPNTADTAKAPNIWPSWRSYLHQILTTQSRSPRLSILETALLFTNRPLETHRAPNLPGLWPQIGSMAGRSRNSERKRRIRIWWGVYIADKWNALGIGRPGYIHAGEWDVPVPRAEDFEGVVGIGAMVFVAMSRVTVILGEVLGEFYSIRAMMRASESESQESGDGDVFGRLEWNPILALSTLRMILYRAVLRQSAQTDPRLISARKSAQNLCMELISFVAKLQVSHLRAFWWAPLSRTNFAIAGSFMVSMLLSSTDIAEITFWTERIARYRGLLEMHSITFDVTKLAVNRLGLIASVIEGRGGGIGERGGPGGVHDGVPRSPDMPGLTMAMPELGNLSSLFGEGLELFVDFQGLDYAGSE